MRSELARRFRVIVERAVSASGEWVASRRANEDQAAVAPAPAHSSVETLESRQLLTTYYVSPWGNDWSSGTSKWSTWKTVARVNQQYLRPGDKVLFQGNNTYYGSLRVDWNEAGAAWSPVTFGSYGGSRATISSGAQPGLDVQQTGGVAVENLVFRGSGMYNNGSNGLHFHVNWGSRALKNLSVNYVDVSGYGGYDIKIEAPGTYSSYSDVRIVNARLHDSREGGIWVNGWANRVNKNYYISQVQAFNHPGTGSNTKVTGSGIFIADVDGATVERSLAYQNGSNGKAPVGIWAAGSNRVTFQYNESHHNMTKSVTDGGGFDFDWDVSNSVMQYNYSHDNHGPGYLICGAWHRNDNNTIRYNISQSDSRRNGRGGIHIYGNANNLKILNNVVYMNATGDGRSAAITAANDGAAGTTMSNIDVRNNVFFTTGGVKQIRVGGVLSGNGSNRFVGNAYYGGRGSAFNIDWGGQHYGSIDSWRWAKGQERENWTNQGYWGDPQLNAAGWGSSLNNAWNLSSLWQYKPKWNSPLINRGVWPNTTLSSGSGDFYGSWLPKSGRFDIGVSEQG